MTLFCPKKSSRKKFVFFHFSIFLKLATLRDFILKSLIIVHIWSMILDILQYSEQDISGVIQYKNGLETETIRFVIILC